MPTEKDPETGYWVFECPDNIPEYQCFRSTGWPTKKAAEARGAEHMKEHDTGEEMTLLSEFAEGHGIQ